MNDSPPKRSCETLSPALLGSTVTVATLIAAGNLDVVGIFSTQASMLLKGALEAMLIAIHKFGGGGLEFVGGFTAFTLPSAQNQDIITLMRGMFRPHLRRPYDSCFTTN